MIIMTRTIKGTDKVEKEIHYGVTSLSSSEASAESLLEIRRSHWTIESKVHWRLDLTFNEDRCRVRNSRVASALSLFRKIALNLFVEVGISNFREGIQRMQMTP
jgi:predicted transposase YbfD/YdcC